MKSDCLKKKCINLVDDPFVTLIEDNRAFPRERLVDPLEFSLDLKSGQIEYLVPKKAEYSETYEKTIFRFIRNRLTKF